MPTLLAPLPLASSGYRREATWDDLGTHLEVHVGDPGSIVRPRLELGTLVLLVLIRPLCLEHGGRAEGRCCEIVQPGKGSWVKSQGGGAGVGRMTSFFPFFSPLKF